MHQKSFDLFEQIFLDHYLILSQIKQLKDVRESSVSQLSNFLDNVCKHSETEQKVIQLLNYNEKMYFHFLEHQIEHEMIQIKSSQLKRILKYRVSNEIMYEEEFEKLFKMLEQNISQEENSLIPLLKKHIEKEKLPTLSRKFKRDRKLNKNQFLILPDKFQTLYLMENYFTETDMFLEEVLCQ